jgi:hypothetical protein
MGGFSDIVKALNPQYGVMLDAQGNVFDRAAQGLFDQQYSLLEQTIKNGASILSIRMTGLAAETDHHFVIDIPAGKELALFNRDLVVTEGMYNVDAISVDSIDLSTGVTDGVTAPLNKVVGTSVDTVLRHKAGGAVNAVVREFGFVDTGDAIGAARSGGTSSTEGVIKILSGPSILRVRKVNEGTFTTNLVFVVWEYDAE